MFIVGDIHGEFERLVDILNNLPKNSNIIQIGDLGLGFRDSDNKSIKWINDELNNLNQRLFVIRGNHDKKEGFFDNYGTYSNLHLLNDYTALNIEGKNCLFVGGAISVDRCVRQENIDYWRDEGVDDSGIDNIKPCDVLFTHTCGTHNEPIKFNDTVYFWYEEEMKYARWNERKLLRELDEEKKVVQRIIEKCKPSFHYYGHFHFSYINEVNRIKTRLLDIEEVVELI